jgi:hypothetical protein
MVRYLVFLKGGGTYQEEYHGSAGLDSLAVNFTWCCCDAHVALRSCHSLSLSNVGMEGRVVTLLRNGLDFSPDGLVLRL